MMQTFPGVLDALTLCAPNKAFNKEDWQVSFHLNEAGTELTGTQTLPTFGCPVRSHQSYSPRNIGIY
jgi:hypothetical protein